MWHLAYVAHNTSHYFRRHYTRMRIVHQMNRRANSNLHCVANGGWYRGDFGTNGRRPVTGQYHIDHGPVGKARRLLRYDLIRRRKTVEHFGFNAIVLADTNFHRSNDVILHHANRPHGR